MATRKLSVEITGDAKGGVSAMKSLGSAGDSMGTKLASVGSKVGSIFKGIALGAGAGLAALAVGAKSSINAASDLAEAQSKVDAVFGESAGAIKDWASGSAEAFGQSKEQALSAAGAYGNLFSAFGLGKKDTEEMSKGLVELAADLASFNNTSIEDALESLQSGVSGETEPLKKFGIAINEVRLQEQALAMGLGDGKTQLTAAAKAQATYALIMKDTALAQGDFARTSDGLANKQRILGAKFKDLQARIGGALLPVVLNLATVFSNKVMPVFEEVGGGIMAFVAAFRDGGDEITSSGIAGFIEGLGIKARNAFDKMSAAFRKAVSAVRPFVSAVVDFIKENPTPVFAGLAVVIGGALLAGVWALAAAVLALFSPFVLVVGGVALLVAGLVLAYQKVDWFRTAVDAVARFLSTVLWPALQAVASYIVGTVVPAVVRFGQQVASFLWPILQRIASFITGTLVPAFQRVASFITGTVVPAVQQMYQWFAANVLPILQRVASVVGGQVVAGFNRAQNAVRALIAVAQAMYNFFAANVLPVIQKVASGIGSAFQAGFGRARSAVQGVIDVVQSVINAVSRAIDKVNGLVNAIKGAASFNPQDLVLEGFAKGGKPAPGVPYLVGEEGPEIRVDGPGTIIPNSKIKSGTGSMSSGGIGGDTYVTVHVGYVASKEQLADEVARALNAKQRRNGSRPILAGVSG